MQQQGYKRATRYSHAEETVIDPAFPPPSLIKTAQQQQQKKMAENNDGKEMEKRKKKEKKWSLGGLFRRRKNKETTTETDSSSLSDNEHAAVKKGFLERRRSARKKRNRGSKDVTGSFEHVIIKRQNNEEAVNSGSSHLLGVPREVSSDRGAGSRSSHESLNKKHHHHHHHETSFVRGSSVSLEGTSRRGGRQQVKARVEATRDRLGVDSSSDEEHSSRHSTSSVQRYRSSDDNLGGNGVKDGSLSRKSRAARTERYIKRLSRDEEAFKEFNLDASAPRVSRSDEKLTTVVNSTSSNNDSNNKNELKVPTGNRWTAKVVYQESSDYDTKYTAKTKSATPSPIQSPKIRPKNALHFTSSAPAAIQNYSTTFPPSHTQQQRGEAFVSVSTQDFSANSNRSASHSSNKLPHKQQQVISHGAFVSPPRLPRNGSNSETSRNMAAETTVPTTTSTTRLYYNNNNNISHSDNAIFNQKKSASFDSNINHSHMFNNSHSSSKSIMHPDPTDSNVLVVQFPIGRPTVGGGSRKEVMKDTVGVVPQSTRLVKQQNPPPPPPPRDPQRKVFHVNGGGGGGSHSEAPTTTRPMSYAFENRTKPRLNGKAATDYNSNNVHMMNYNSGGGSRQHHNNLQDHFGQTHHHGVTAGIKQHQRSNSDQQLLQSSSSSFNHHYVTENSPPVQRRTAAVQRSPSVDVALAANRIPRHYQYYTDQQPRSRKPIQPVTSSAIQNQRVNTVNDQPYLSDSQMVVKPPYQQVTRVRPVQHATEFWRQKEQESGMKVHLSDGSPKLIQKHLLHTATVNNQERSQSASPRHDVVGPVGYGRPRLPPLVMPTRGAADSTSSLSGQSDLSASPRVAAAGHHFKLAHNEIGIPVYDGDPAVDGGQNKDRPLSMVLEKSESGEQHDSMSSSAKKDKTPPAPPQRRYSKTLSGNTSESDQKYSSNSNLEEALSELEAIYKSLRLGEEALQEKRGELSADPAGNRYDPSNWSAWVQSRGFESDSSFNYSRSSSVDSSSVDSPLRRRVTAGCRKATVPDRVTDDMAYRRLNKKDRAPSLEQNVISQAGSFLLVSPTLSPPPLVESPPPPPVQPPTQEPDITLDDVVYRNIKHTNNTLKITDPQPPFGIPLGPISPAPNSDYLHVIPKERYRSTFKPRKTPDVITDDLAFRNLRKDDTKTVPMFAPEDGTPLDSTALRRKRAVRSLSANLLSIIQKDAYSKYFNNSNNNNNKTMSNYNLRNGSGGGGGNGLEKSQSFSDLPDALAIAHRILDEKENLMMTGSNLLRVKNRSKRNSVGNDYPDATPRASRCSDVSSLGVSTSTETLTDSRVNLRSHDEPSVQQSSAAYGRLSATPERRTGAGDQSDKLSSKFDSHDHRSNRYSVTPEKITTKQNDSSRSYGVVRSQGSRDSTSLTQSDSELLDFLAKEAKATSEQIGRELKELSSNGKPEKKKLEITLSSSNNGNSTNKQVPQNSVNSNTSSPSKNSLTIGKVVHHKPVRLNTFSITDDNVLENKTIISSKPIEDLEESNSKSMTDLLKELTRCLDSDFGGGGGGGTTTDDNTNKSTSPSICSRLSILEDDEDSKRTCDPNSNDKESSPNISKRTASIEKKNSQDAEKRCYDDDADVDSNSKYENKIRKTASGLSKLSQTTADDQQDDDDDEEQGEKQVVKTSSIKLTLNLGSSLLSDIKQQPNVRGSDKSYKGKFVKEEQTNSRMCSDDNIVKNEDNKSGISSNKNGEQMRDKNNTGDENISSSVVLKDGDDEGKKNNIKCDDGSDNDNDSLKKQNDDEKKKVEDNSCSCSSSSTTTHLVHPSSSSKSKQGDGNQRGGDQCSTTTTTNEGKTCVQHFVRSCSRCFHKKS